MLVSDSWFGLMNVAHPADTLVRVFYCMNSSSRLNIQSGPLCSVQDFFILLLLLLPGVLLPARL